MLMDLGTRNTLLYDFMHCMTAVSLEMSDEPECMLPFREKVVPLQTKIQEILFYYCNRHYK